MLEQQRRYWVGLNRVPGIGAARLQALDTSGISPTSSVQPARSKLRPDEPRPGLSLRDALRNAPEIENDQFRVPPILE